MNRISQFWQELKRRNVVRRNTVYAATAFVIIELVDIISEPFGLPDWTLKFVVVLLSIGFIISVIISWIYDFNPEGGLEKTKPVQKVKNEDKPVVSSTWKIASIVSFAVIVVLIVLNIIPRSNNKEILEKSIAVLPFKYLSEDPNKRYLADGVLDAITGHLSTIKGLKVMPRTSVEQYRENTKSAKEIGEDLDVSYLIEGSFLMIENQVKLTIQLVVANEGDHVFFKEYDRNYKDIIVVQSEVAQTIAKEIEVAITPEEKQIIDKIPTTNQTAYDFYLRGREEERKHSFFNPNVVALEKAELLYQYALEYDSTFAQAYLGLAGVYFKKNYLVGYLSENFIDSALNLVNIALSYDDQLAQAYSLRGNLYFNNGDTAQAIKEYDKAIKLNPNDWYAYRGKGHLYMSVDLVQSIDNFHKAASLNRGPELPELLRSLSEVYNQAGFPEKRIYYSQEALNLDGDSVEYYLTLGGNEYKHDNLEKAIEYYKKGYAIDSTNRVILHLHIKYMKLGQYEEALFYLKKRVEIQQTVLPGSHLHFGFLYWQMGDKQEAENHFNEVIEYYKKAHDLNRGGRISTNSYYHLASVYAIRGEKAKAYENLKQISLQYIVEIKSDPMFYRLRDDPEFQQIVRDMEIKYQAEHERVRQWLEENEMF